MLLFNNLNALKEEVDSVFSSKAKKQYKDKASVILKHVSTMISDLLRILLQV